MEGAGSMSSPGGEISGGSRGPRACTEARKKKKRKKCKTRNPVTPVVQSPKNCKGPEPPSSHAKDPLPKDNHNKGMSCCKEQSPDNNDDNNS